MSDLIGKNRRDNIRVDRMDKWIEIRVEVTT
jgi:hypothetical protein